MTILVLGANGQVGREIIELSQVQTDKIHRVLGMGRHELDITDNSVVQRVINSIKPALIINAAAYTAVDKAESEVELAFAINRDGVANVAQCCADLQIPLIHISTDYIFDGAKSTAYVETDTANPHSVYGESKWLGEQRIRQVLDKHIILRTSWVFGKYGRNFVFTMMALARKQPILRVVDDQHGCPTSAASIAAVILTIAESIQNNSNSPWGVYHFCGTPATTWYQFCQSILELSRSDETFAVQELVAIETKDFPTPAARPKNSVLNCDKIHKSFGISQSHWREDLQDMLSIRHSNNSITGK